MRRKLLALMGALALTACSSGEPPSSWQNYATLGLYSAAISKDGSMALIGAQEEGGSLWNIAKKSRDYDWNHRQGERSIIASVAFSPEGKFAVTANQQDLVLWHTDTGMPEWFWSSPGEILDMALSPDGNYALLGLANHTAVFFDVKNGGVQRTFRHGGRVRSVALSPDGRTAITGADDYTTTLWDIQSGEQIHQRTLENIIDSVAISDDGQTAFSASSLDKAIIWDVGTGKIRHTLSGDESFMPRRVSYLDARFSESGLQLLTGNSAGLVQLWNAKTGKLVKTWEAHKKDPYGPNSTSIYAVGFKGPKSYLAIGSNGVLNQLK